MKVPNILEVKTYQEAERLASSFLGKIGENPQEARWLILEKMQWNLTDWLLHQRDAMLEAEKEQLQIDLERKAAGEPIQYILGQVEFLGHPFSVTPATLIPRPETELWLEQVLIDLKDVSEPLEVLDIGTGTGVIAISHQLNRPEDRVTATDISQEALEVAKQNGEILNAEVEWLTGDLFAPVKGRTFDVIYSNPPYIGEEEIDEMTENVLKFEPHLALFAEESGYQIYRKIAEQVNDYLNPAGRLYLEIGHLQAEKVTELLKREISDATITCIQDGEGRDRLIYLQTPENVK